MQQLVTCFTDGGKLAFAGGIIQREKIIKKYEKIGLIGTINSGEVIEYYSYVNHAIGLLNPGCIQSSTFVYPVKLFTDEESDNVIKLWKAIFYMMGNNVKAIILCNHTLEHFGDYINPEVMGGLPLIQSGTTVANEVRKMKRLKLVILAIRATEELHSFFTSLKNCGIELLLLHKSNRKKLSMSQLYLSIGYRKSCDGSPSLCGKEPDRFYKDLCSCLSETMKAHRI